MNNPTATDIRSIPGSFEPIISGFYPDPTVCRVDNKYYIANSSFEYFPGVPIWESTDLLNWTQIGNILDRPSQFTPGTSKTSSGIYAPTLRFHNGTFWMITTDISAAGHILFSATDPTGPWSEPIRIEGIGGIDPDLAWDDNGNCYLTCCTSVPGHWQISQSRINLQTGTLMENPRIIWNGTGLQWPEGPHLYQVEDYWYLMIAEGGTERGHAVSIARSKSPEGPFEGNPNNPIFTHRSSDHPVHSVGHADLVQRSDGTWAMVYLGTRVKGYLPGQHVNGRETFLAGIIWENGWPVVQENYFSVPPKDNSFTEDFHGKNPLRLGLRWISPGAAISKCAEQNAEGVVLSKVEAPNGSVTGLGFRVRDQRWEIEVDVNASEAAAVRLRYDDQHWYEVGVKDGKVLAYLHIGPAESIFELSTSGEVTLIVSSVDSLTNGPDDIILGFSDASGVHQLVRADGRYLSTEVAGGFIGRVVVIHSREESSLIKKIRYISK